MALFTFGAIGKNGKQYCIMVNCDSFDNAKNIIEQLNLEVGPKDYGKLIKEIEVTTEELIRITGERAH
ncbi:MAG: hypothetical protein ABW146_08460 [Candidatus Sedimenticola sp. 6PFRAG7]